MRKYGTCFFMGMQNAIEYRFDFFMSYLSAVFPIIIQVSMWTAIYQSARNEILYGYSYYQMILYTFFVGIVGKFLSTGFEYEINEDIKTGGLNKYIIKPINYCFYRIFCFLGKKVSLSVVFLAILIVLSGVFTVWGYFELRIETVCYFFLALFLTLLLQFSAFFCIGMTGFWASEISRVFPAISIVLNVMSGGIFPLDILGERVNRIITFLPFQYLMQFPVDILTGKDFDVPLIFLFAIQIAWIIIFWTGAQILWKIGMKKYIAVGG